MKRIILPILTVLVMAFIFFESSLSGETSSRQSSFLARLFSDYVSPETVFLIRKAAHFSEFAVLGVLLMLLFEDLAVDGIWNRMIGLSVRGSLAFAAGAAYGISDEVHQLFVPERSCELRDMAIDASGVFIGVLAVTLFLLIRSRRRKKQSEN